MNKKMFALIAGIALMTTACSSAQKTEDENSAQAVIQETLDVQLPSPITVNFAFDSAFITKDYSAAVKLFVKNIKQENFIINVDGYTDDIGSDLYNDKLSMQRAEAVADYLTDNGVNRDIIITRGFGKTNFVADNDTEEGRAKNRRVEISVSEK